MNDLSELTPGTELELTYDGNNGPRTVTVYTVEHETSDAILDKYDAEHDVTFAEPGARRPRFVRLSVSTPADGEFDASDAGYGSVRSLNSKSERGRRLGRLLGVEIVGDAPERFDACADLRTAEDGDVLTVEGERGTVVSNGHGTTVEFDDGTQEQLRTSPELGVYRLTDDYDREAVHVEATGESVEAPEADREAFETCESYGHDDERGKVVAVEHAGETYEVAYRHDADDEGIRFETEGRVGHDTLDLDALGLVLDGERVHADDLDLVFENDEQADEADEDEQGDDESDESGVETDEELTHDGGYVLDPVSEGDEVRFVYDSRYTDEPQVAGFEVDTRYGRRVCIGDETDGDRRLRLDLDGDEPTVESLHHDGVFRAFGSLLGLTFDACDEPSVEQGDDVLMADGGTDLDALERGDDRDADDVSEGDAVLVHYESVYGETGDDSHEVRGTVVETGGVRVVVEATDGETYDLVLDGGLAVELEKRDANDNPRRVGFPAAVASSGEQGDDGFEVGEQVAEDAEDGGTMRVLDPDVGEAGEVEVGTTGVVVSEYDGNEDVPDDERVVECVFEGFLDSNVPEWELTPAGDLPEFLDAYTDEWGVSIRTYSYPESRLTGDVSDDDDETTEGTDDDGDGEQADESDESEPSMPEPTVDARDDGDYDAPEPSDDLPTEADLDMSDEAEAAREAFDDSFDDEDEQGDDLRTDGGGSWLILPSPEAIARHAYPFPDFSATFRHRAAVHELVLGQVERAVEAESEVFDA